MQMFLGAATPGLPSSFILHLSGKVWPATSSKTRRKGWGRGFGEVGLEDQRLQRRMEAGERVGEFTSLKCILGRFPTPPAHSLMPISPPSSPSLPGFLLPAQALLWLVCWGPLCFQVLSHFQSFAKAASLFLLSFHVPSRCCTQENPAQKCYVRSTAKSQNHNPKASAASLTEARSGQSNGGTKHSRALGSNPSFATDWTQGLGPNT